MSSQDLMKALLTSDTNTLSIYDIFLAISIPFVLCVFIGLFYRKTSKMNVYSSSFVMAMPLFGALSSVITLLIGSNIARAFGLVGALSLIRFRTALKEPLDSVYLFWCLSVGMACGTGFYLAAVIIVLLCSLYLFILYKIKFSESTKVYLVLKAKFNKDVSEDEVLSFEKHASKFFTEIKTLNLYVSADQNHNEYVYSVRLKKRYGTQTLIDQLQDFKGVVSVSLVSQDSALFL